MTIGARGALLVPYTAATVDPPSFCVVVPWRRRTPKLLHEHNEYLNAAVYLEGAGIYRELTKDLAGPEGPEGPQGVEKGSAAAAEGLGGGRDEL